MKRRISVLAGVLCGVIVTSIGEMINHQIYPIPEGLDFKNPEQTKAFVEGLPLGAFILLLVTWMISSFAGGLVTAKIVGENWVKASLITGGILMLAAIVNVVMIPHPVWLATLTIIQYLPMAYLGGKVISK